MTGPASADLGFVYRRRRDGTVEVLHGSRLACTLRGADALDFIAEVEAGTPADAQQLMARVTGNYKRGNERRAGEHPRNRRRERMPSARQQRHAPRRRAARRALQNDTGTPAIEAR